MSSIHQPVWRPAQLHREDRRPLVGRGVVPRDERDDFPGQGSRLAHGASLLPEGHGKAARCSTRGQSR